MNGTLRSLASMTIAICALGGCHYYGGCGGWDDDDDWCFGPECEDHEEPPGCVGIGCDASAPRADAGPSSGCAADSDCPSGEACLGGACGPLASGLCREGTDCAEGELCVEGACVAAGDACRFDHDCGLGRGCVDNACRPRCADPTECGSGTACVDGLCRPTVQCAGDAECAATERCVESRCLTACADASGCGPEELCAPDGVCRPDVAPRPFCATDADCAAGHLCVFGVCRTPCPTRTDEECLRWDSQLIRCDESESGLWLCFSRHETNPECLDPSDCGAGESCIDAICHP